jgi:hypothetical protein
MISTGRKVCRRSESIEGASPEPPLNVGMITLTEALLAAPLSFRLLTPNKARETSDSVKRGMSNIRTEKASRKKLAPANTCTISNMEATSATAQVQIGN